MAQDGKRVAACAPVWKRALAHYIDLLIVSIPPCIFIIAIYTAIGPAGERHRIPARYETASEGFLFLWFFLTLAYFVLPEATRGATPGKYLLGIKVVALDGGRCDFRASFIRNILRVVDGLFGYLIGLLFALASSRRQRLGDRLAGTVVISSCVPGRGGGAD